MGLLYENLIVDENYEHKHEKTNDEKLKNYISPSSILITRYYLQKRQLYTSFEIIQRIKCLHLENRHFLSQYVQASAWKNGKLGNIVQKKKMRGRTMEPARKQEVINVCLETFMEKGLPHTSTRDLGAALNMNHGAMFYYFKNKDEAVIACAEEASIRIENDLIGLALKDIENPEKMVRELKERADDMRPLMKFFVSVCSCSKYEDALQPTLDRLTLRYDSYAKKFAEVLRCDTAEVSPYVYIGINAMLSYMLFGQKRFSAPQLDLVYNALVGFLEKRDEKN